MCVCVCVCVCLIISLYGWDYFCVHRCVFWVSLVLFSFFFSFFFFYCLVGCLSMIDWTPAVLDVLYACVLYFCNCICSAQFIVFHVERCSRNMLIIIIIIINMMIVKTD